MGWFALAISLFLFFLKIDISHNEGTAVAVYDPSREESSYSFNGDDIEAESSIRFSETYNYRVDGKNYSAKLPDQNKESVSISYYARFPGMAWIGKQKPGMTQAILTVLGFGLVMLLLGKTKNPLVSRRRSRRSRSRRSVS
jgi:hypothetical protein